MYKHLITGGCKKVTIIIKMSIINIINMSFFVELIILLSLFLIYPSTIVNAQNKTEILQGEVYEFNSDSKYDLSTSAPIKTKNTIGTLSVSGEFNTTGKGKETRYCVKNNSLTLTYKFDKAMLDIPKSDWHPTNDSTTVVNGINLEDPVDRGAIIIQTSLDKNKWVTDTKKTNIFTDDYNNSEALYVTKDIQLVNGCYYRIIVAYEQEKIISSLQFDLIPWDDKYYVKNADVYEFYAENPSEKALSNANLTPRKELGDKICVKKDSGYSEQIILDRSNPHYGWNLGTFSVNGYTRETTDNGIPMFLKNAGDKVTLWFKLLQDIDDLNGEGHYRIIEDKNGSDQYFEIPETNFKRGALIIRFTDHEGVKHDPIIYTDYLAADATTGADTKAVLFEEGDYEVALDYTIDYKDSWIGEDYWMPENDYRIFFKFSIRNGNTMFFPFDLSSGAELRDKAITSKGFMIDMAKSRYLNINVMRTAIIDGTYGHSEDIRFNGVAKDGAKYTEKGVYTVDVTNRYTGEHTVKTFYVGTDPFMIAMAKSGKTVKELDEFISQGYTIEADGSLVAPTEPETTIEETTEEPIEEINSTEEVTMVESMVEETTIVAESSNIKKETESVVTEEVLEEKVSDSTGLIIGLLFICLVAICFYAISKRNRTETKIVDLNSNQEPPEGIEGDKHDEV